MDTCPKPPPSRTFTALLRPDPPESPISERGTDALHELADKICQLEGLHELGRDERFYQVELHLRHSP